MADLKISQLGAAAALGGAELLAGVQSGGNVKITPGQILSYIIGAATLTEAMQDMVAAFLAAGSGISLSYNDAGNALTIASSNPRYNFATSDPTPSSDGAAGYAIGSTWFNSASAMTWRCLDASNGAAVWFPHSQDHPGYVSGNYYPVPHTSSITSVASAPDTLYAAPIYIAQRVVASGLGLRVATGVASTAAKLGLYASGGGRPSALLAAGGSVATTTGGDVFSAFASSLTLVPGWYWIAVITNGAPTFLTLGGATEHLLGQLTGSATMQQLTQASATNNVSGLTGSGATYAGGLPATFGAATLATGTAAVPIGCIKIA